MQPRHRALPLLVVLAIAAACTAAYTAPLVDGAPPVGLRAFGSMREVMRMGNDAGRTGLMQFSSTETIGVGALAGLNGEITIVDGEVLVATVRDGVATTRHANDTDQATLLVAEDVRTWHAYPIGSCASYDALEERVAKLVRERDMDPLTPIPIRIRGNVTRLQVHVIAGACPIATPNGPSPWRYDGPADNVKLVGFYVEGAAGKWTHHTHQSHLHAVSDQAMGHLDGVVIADAIVMLPAARPN